MARITSIFFILAVLIQPLGLLFFPISYALLQDYYATELCREKENPESECNGLCFLNDQLDLLTDKPGDKKAPTFTFERVINLYLPSAYHFILTIETVSNSLNADYIEITPFELIREIIIPPKW